LSYASVAAAALPSLLPGSRSKRQAEFVSGGREWRMGRRSADEEDLFLGSVSFVPFVVVMSANGDQDDLDLGIAGASARREHERRKDRRERRTREKHRRLGGIIWALQDDPSHEQVWARGAKGEERVARSLAKYLDKSVRVLHDRRVPRSRANIDHIAVGSSGVWVIDAKRYDGKAEIRKPLFGEPTLLIKGRDQSKLVEGLARQVELVRATLAGSSPDVRVNGALCFVDTDLPMLGTLTFNGYPLLYPRRLAKRINSGGPLSAETVDTVLRTLAAAFPPA
jgi:hypothetical protein